MNRLGVAIALVVGVSSAQAGVEIGGTAGVHIFNEENALGDSATFSQANSALFALRLGFGITDMFGIEVEGGVIPTESAGGNVTFDIYNAIVRGQVVAQFRAADPSNKILPFVLGGGGVMRVVDIGTNDDSLFKKDDMDPVFHFGIGAKYRAGGGWGVRLDARALLPKKDGGGVTTEFEMLASLYREFGGKKPAPKPEPPKADQDPDKDGIAGEADKCPAEPEDKDDFEDDNGCPDPDNDGDGVPDASDKCIAEAEDKDSFQDEDGCPDPDNDGDGVPDATDKCGDQPETKNGFEDEDGCPDQLPEKLAKYTGTIAGINFKVNSSDLLPGSFKTLDKAVAVLTEFKDVKVEIQGHTDDQALKKGGKFADNDALSQARAESVKAYFVKKGIGEDRLIAKGYGASQPIDNPEGLKGGKLNAARTKNRRVEFKLISPGDEGGAAPAGGEPKAEEPKKDEPKAEEPKKDEPKKDEPKAEEPKKE